MFKVQKYTLYFETERKTAVCLLFCDIFCIFYRKLLLLQHDFITNCKEQKHEETDTMFCYHSSCDSFYGKPCQARTLADNHPH